MIEYKILSKENTNINHLEEWKKIFFENKKKGMHWKDGRSAKELARYILEKEGINEILAELNIEYSGSLTCYPEHITALPQKGKGRTHDLLIVPEDNSFIISIEAKTDESFDEYCKNRDFSKGNRKGRYIELKKILFGDKPVNCNDLRYQLLTATAGTLIEAENREITNIYFLALNIRKEGEKYQEKQIEYNKVDFEKFKALIPEETNIKLKNMNISV